jgi:hypothetical protein
MAPLKLNRATNIVICHFCPGEFLAVLRVDVRTVAYANMEVSTKYQRALTQP